MTYGLTACPPFANTAYPWAMSSGDALPPPEQRDKPLGEELAVYARAGGAVFINSAIWHSGGCNHSDGLRRGIYLYYGHWWLKRYEYQQDLPWQALDGASPERLRLLGMNPPSDLHIFPVDGSRILEIMKAE